MSENGAASHAAIITAIGSVLPAQAPCGTARCPAGRIRLGIFFDGTGNNMYRDWGPNPGARRRNTLPAADNPELNGPTNVAKLHELFPEIPGIQKKVYFIGVGAGTRNSRPGRGDNIPAQMSGWGARRRIDGALAALREFVNAGNNQLAPEKRVDVFGFSRGAAQARDFINKVNRFGIDNTSIPLERAVQWVRRAGDAVASPTLRPGARRTTGILFEFLGIFDTVASMGLGAIYAGVNITYNFHVPGRPAQGTPARVLAGNDIRAKEQWVHRTFHAVAEDEYRENFAVQLIQHRPGRGYLPLPMNLQEKPYPGAHSDIGGGYRDHPGRRARQRTAYARGNPVPVHVPAVPPSFGSLCNIPLEDMHAEARAAGLQLLPLRTLPPVAYNVPADLRRDYQQYATDRMHFINGQLSRFDLDRRADHARNPVFIHGLAPIVYFAVRRQRLQSEALQRLFHGYIHTSMDTTFWIASAVTRLFNLSRLPESRRGVRHGGRQASY